jgi:hypothetical protein
VESNGRPDNRPRSTSQAGEGICMRCGGLMVTEYYMDLQDDTGQIGITGLRCTSCGEVIDPVILRNRLYPTPNLLHVVKQRKYAQRIDQSESDGQDRNGQGNDTKPGD